MSSFSIPAWLRKEVLAMGATVMSLSVVTSSCTKAEAVPDEFTITKENLLDKIKGGWAGQVLGCTYGGPTEFVYRGTMMQDYIPIRWDDGFTKQMLQNNPSLYDDIYMDLTFVDVMERYGIDAPVDSFAVAFANAGYYLWHANQAARYNIQHGIMPPASGHWKNNPHANDIDYQIEADYAGLMCPGMPNSASEISDKIGHIMNYGDGFYGGVYVGAMYSLAFISDDIEFIVEEALKTIPAESDFHKCMADVIACHRKNPDDWKQAWFECERKWTTDVGCTEGVYMPLDIDATINSAYVIIGLLYGDGDFEKTLDISTRCGQDSDCNPATAGGILATVLGYNNIPEKFKVTLGDGAEDINFAYTDISLNKTYDLSFKHALQMVERNGGKVEGDDVVIKCQKPVAVPYEKSFEGIKPAGKQGLHRNMPSEGDITVTLDCSGVVFAGYVDCSDKSYVAEVEMYIDGELAETAQLPASYRTRRLDLFWKYDLQKGPHTFTFKWLNPQEGATVRFTDIILYDPE
ncbi:MAG: ADP-ribosylglycohydrolase family protein [Bacteroidales bacterium]|nr:ADP-ribosylglycohydrolase family protein [Bacteroidales bacterium]